MLTEQLNPPGKWWEFNDEQSPVAVPDDALYADAVEGAAGAIDRLFDEAAGHSGWVIARHRRKLGSMATILSQLRELLPTRQPEIDFQAERVDMARCYPWLSRRGVDELDEP